MKTLRAGEWVRCVNAPGGTNQEVVGWVGKARSRIETVTGPIEREHYDLILETPTGRIRRLFWPNVAFYEPTVAEQAAMMRLEAQQKKILARRMIREADQLIEEADRLEAGH